MLLTASVPNGTLAVIMNNREKLLHHALQLFAARGYDAVGVQEIALASGIQKPTLYHYFGNKKGLLFTLLNENFEPFFGKLQLAASYKGDITLSLQTVARAYFTFAGQNPRLYRFYLSMWFAPVESEAFEATVSVSEHQQSLLEALFIAAASDHGNMRGRHRAYAASFLGMINTYIMLSLNEYTDLSDEIVYTMVHQFMHGIFS